MEACATSHHWARELTRLGHQVRLMPAKDVKANVKRCVAPRERTTPVLIGHLNGTFGQALQRRDA
jgi:transposase